MKRGFSDPRLAMMLAFASGLTGGFSMESDITGKGPRQEPDNRGRRAEKDAAKLAKAEAKRARKAEKRLKENK